MSLKHDPYPDDASAHSNEHENEEDLPFISRAASTALKPLHIATSRPARRAYLTTLLLVLAALFLLGLAIVAYTLFYWNYVPRIGFTRTLHLQFDNVLHASHSRYDEAANPYGTVDIRDELVSGQRYDVRVVLELPRSRGNREVGNFMVEAGLYAQGVGMLDEMKEGLAPGLAEKDNRIATSRRPAILAYRSFPLECLTRALQLPFYLIGWRSESETVTVGLWEGLEFARGWKNVPARMRVEVQSLGRMQVAQARVEWRARLRGLRWVMYNHRVISAMVFVSAFWVTECLFMGLAWVGVSFLWRTPEEAEGGQDGKVAVGDGPSVKQEPSTVKGEKRRLSMSETERTFPSSSKQELLRYQSPTKGEEDSGPTIKQEDEDDVPRRTTEADDEDEDLDFVDSGLGTSMESSAARRDSVRKRRGRQGREREDE